MKKYIDFMDEITPDELLEGLLGHGMFADKLPPVFTSEGFYLFCKDNPSFFSMGRKRQYVYFESMRNTQIPRSLGIPTPLEYASLCAELSKNWDGIKKVFRDNTHKDKYKISRIHIRKMLENAALFQTNYDDPEPRKEDVLEFVFSETVHFDKFAKELFSMNYKNWETDGDPLIDFSIGKKYVAKTDISQCFPSIYTHSISWGLVGKKKAKTEQNKQDHWFNKIDKACRNMKDGETQGLLIGPHASNLLSEIILTTVDSKLSSKYDFTRSIDDYTCYTATHEESEFFLRDLNTELKKFNLSLNHKKTIIQELPQAYAESWVQRLKDQRIVGRYKKVDCGTANAYLDTATLLMKENGGNASTILFAIKVLGNSPISENACRLCVKRMSSLAIIYPYLVPMMDEHVFAKFHAEVSEIETFTRALYKDSERNSNFEGIRYALFYALKYGFMLQVDAELLISSSDCISKLLLWIYAQKFNLEDIANRLVEEAKRLKNDHEFDENWVFAYEVLPSEDLSDEWKVLKDNGISFLRTI